MARQRTNRFAAEGIDKRDNGRYRARYTDEDGRTHQQTFDRLADAKAWRKQQQTALMQGTHVDPRDRTTVLAYAERWNLSRSCRPTTAAHRANALRVLQREALANMVLAKVRPSDVQAYIGNLSKTLAPSTINRHHGWLKAVFASAVEDRIVTFTPCTSRISLPKVQRERIVPLTVEQVVRLADCTDDRYRIGMLLQASLGLRISELLGLQVGDVDFLRNTVRIERQLSKHGGLFVPPKTEYSRRTIPLAENVKLELARHIELFPPNKDDLILSGELGAAVRLDKWSIKVFRPAATRAGLADTITSHDLRHHFASEHLSRGVPANVVAEFLGHADAALVIRTYGHTMPSAEAVMRASINAAWSMSPAMSWDQASDR